MLPGFRFLFAAIALSISILVFSLGAAALLRAAHQEFASMPRLITAEPVFAQRNEAEPALAMLHADPVEASPSEAPKADDTQVQAAAVEPSAASSDREGPLPEAEKISMRDDAAMPAEDLQSPAPPDAPQTERPATVETMMEVAALGDRDVAAIDEAIPVTSAPATLTAAVEGPAVTDDSTRIAMTRIATLGGPAVNIGPRAKVRHRKTPKKHPAAAVEKFAPKQRAVTRPKAAPRPRIARAVSRPAAAPAAAPFGSWDNRWAAPGPAGKTAFGF